MGKNESIIIVLVVGAVLVLLFLVSRRKNGTTDFYDGYYHLWSMYHDNNGNFYAVQWIDDETGIPFDPYAGPHYGRAHNIMSPAFKNIEDLKVWIDLQ